MKDNRHIVFLVCRDTMQIHGVKTNNLDFAILAATCEMVLVINTEIGELCHVEYQCTSSERNGCDKETDGAILPSQ